MTLTEQDIRIKYETLNGGDPDKIVALFAPDAEYRQIDSGQVALGRDRIRDVMEGWRYFFGDNPGTEDITVIPAHRLVAEIPGATQCFAVDFVAVGVYQNTFPGLEQVAPAHGRPVRVPIGETVWLNDTGEFIRVDSTMKIVALTK